MDPTARTRRWMEEAVIGLGLCPFAAAEARAERVRIAICEEEPGDSQLLFCLEEARSLLETDPDEVATTLMVLTRGPSDFEEFCALHGRFEAALSAAGADGLLQVPGFHPAFRFPDGSPDDAGDWVNRAPYPTLQLLREEQVSAAVAEHPDPGGIPDRNRTALGALGVAELRRLWRQWTE